MSKKKEKIFLFISDFIFINLAWVIYYYIRVDSGWIVYANPPSFLMPLIVIFFYWIIIFLFTGLYQHWFVRSRFDEFVSVVKSVSIGCLILFFTIFIDDSVNNAAIISRYIILIYWGLLIICVGTGRVLVRSFQMNLLAKGIGLKNTLIVGNGRRAIELNEMVASFPQLGFRIKGYVSIDETSINETLGDITSISEIIKNYDITEILIALEDNQKSKLMEIIQICSIKKVTLRILPDMYEIVSGLVKTNQIYGVPLIEVTPDIMTPTSKLIKRIFDFFISLTIILILSPILILIYVIIKFSSKGPVFYKQIRVGKEGKEFNIYKFRSMILESEKSGPIWASGKDDPRVTKIGKFIRKTHLDELPQFINVLKNDMSIVGPRPERPFFVEKLMQEIPYYYKRLSVKPGITGWAQVKHTYDSSLEDVKIKLKYDFYYIENMSLKLDFKIMIITVLNVVLMKGH